MATVFKTHLKTLMLKKSVEVGDALTQKRVAADTGLSYPAISRWHSGEVDRLEADSTQRLMKYFNCGLCDLVEIVEIEE
jgi:hypothetical protein